MLFCNHEVSNGIFSIDFETANDYRIAHARLVLSVYSLIKPAKMYFRPDFIDIHGISFGDVRNSPQFPEVWQTIFEPFLKKSENEIIYFIAHNALADSQTCGKIFSLAAEKLNCTTQELFLTKGFCKIL